MFDSQLECFGIINTRKVNNFRFDMSKTKSARKEKNKTEKYRSESEEDDKRYHDKKKLKKSSKDSSRSSSSESSASSNSSNKDYKRKEVNEKKRSHRNQDRSPSREGNRHHHSKWDDSPNNKRRRSRSRQIEQEHSRERHQSTEYRTVGDDHQRRFNSDRRREYDDKGRNNRNDYRSSGREERGRDNDRYRTNNRRNRSRSRSPRREHKTEQYSPKNGRYQKRYNRDKDDKNYEWGKKNNTKNTDASSTKPIEKEKPNFGLSGALTEDANKVNGTVIKYAEPPEARKPKRMWRLYPFKGETALPTLHIHRQSCFLVGRDRKVVDLAVDHPSCSKQHAALQYRLVPFEREDGTNGKRVRLYLIDLESANGTFLNNKKIDSRKYYELMEKDVIKFGFSTREYVLLHENSKEQEEDDDVPIKQEPDN
ncbi:smad nuclear-interacting protein 1 [Teleopsis dalmanni]|uniref:smad nuclear-interacting protein 1 n=1 Tax=Teleopsis dalmanni TaxID=139649 RepID=UPI000D32B592|nr:smad nuclear-interacting protein 1 [Teleopsis dalmanni]